MWSYYSGTDGYKKLEIAKDTMWDEFIQKLVDCSGQ